MSPPGIEPGLPQPQCGVIATIRRRQDMIIQKKEILMLITIFKKENYLVTIPVSTSIVS